MSNMHVLTQSGGLYRIVLHIAIPTGNNSAGFPWRTVIVTSGIGGKTTLPDGDGTAGTISSAEKTAIITTGSVYEETVVWDVSRGGTVTGAALLTRLDELYAARSAEVLTGPQGFQVQLEQFGRTR